MNALKSLPQRSALRCLKICLGCFGIAGTAVLTAGVLKLGLLDNDRKLEQAYRLLSPLAEGLKRLVEHAIY